MHCHTLRHALSLSFAILICYPAVRLHAQADKPERTSFYVEPLSYGTKRETDPPRYVRELSALGFEKVHEADWIHVGLDTRNRTEYRQNDIRRNIAISEDIPVLFKSRAYLGVEEVFGFLGATAEFQDSRRYNSQFAIDNRDWNPTTFIQAYGELKFSNLLPGDPLGNDRPVLIRGGRMAFEFLDRRLIALNQWRNTTNNFLGARVSLGQDKNDWQLDLLVLQPITRVVDSFSATSDADTTNTDIWFYGGIGHWRKWSDKVTLEPYYLGLRQMATASNAFTDRALIIPGLRAYHVYKNGIDFDIAGTMQFGNENGQEKFAWLYTADLGYTVKQWKWRPRFSVFLGVASGDKDPEDAMNNRFERLYGFGRPWSADDYIIPENVIHPRVKFECTVSKALKFDGGYALYWVQSPTDRMSNLLAGTAGNRDKTGQSGNFIGHGPEARISLKLWNCIDMISGYSHFITGEFVQNLQDSAVYEHAAFSNFFYIETTINFMDIVRELHKQ